MIKIPKAEYLIKAKQLSIEETERVLSRMGGKLPRRIEKRKLTQDEALAIQLELEDEQLDDWRKAMHVLKKKFEHKNESEKETKVKAEEIIKVQKINKSQTNKKSITKTRNVKAENKN